ncbi:hypothetical protein MRB53_028450 [Persea americana]|uniref:Uncharacterized protein n=1 Tax=Persea americana TaxID=3435 RepID=A0ACC2KFQ4_PERAE|nr:hypothetical protein MRB53_028450 [Persea americana]
MTSMPCSFHLQYPHCSSSSCLQKLRKPFFGGNRNGVLGSFRPQRIGLRIVPTPYSRAKCWFRFGKNGVDAEGAGIYGSQTRDDFDRDDVEQYFNYMGMLAVEGSYDKMDALLRQSIHPVDILLMMAASEGDKPKIEELLRAGASYDVKDEGGRTALDRAANEEIKEFILGFSIQNA